VLESALNRPFGERRGCLVEMNSQNSQEFNQYLLPFIFIQNEVKLSDHEASVTCCVSAAEHGGPVHHLPRGHEPRRHPGAGVSTQLPRRGENREITRCHL